MAGGGDTGPDESSILRDLKRASWKGHSTYGKAAREWERLSNLVIYAVVFQLILWFWPSFVRIMLSFVFFNTSNKYQVVQVPGKGEGSIATQDLKAGEVILTETPLIQISGQEAESHLSTGDHFMKDLFDALPSGKRDQALKLHSKRVWNLEPKV